MTTPNATSIYQIKTEERLKEKWAVWFNGLNVCLEKPGDGSRGTTLFVTVPDQAALRGVLNKLWDLNLTLISVIQQDPNRSIQ